MCNVSIPINFENIMYSESYLKKTSYFNNLIKIIKINIVHLTKIV